MKILFLHGLESSPGGAKVKYLEALGHEVLNPVLPKEDFEASINIAQKEYDKNNPDVIVGSSRGGAIAMAMDSGNTKTVLIAPAYRKFNVTPTHATTSGNDIILHSICDVIVPVVDSANLVTEFNYNLHVCGADHRMSDPDALKMLLEVLCPEDKKDS